MAINYAKIFNRRATPQSQPIPGSNQVRNSGGGYSWQVDDWTRFDRFLILGAEGGTYYIAERKLVKQNHDAIVRCIKADGIHPVNRIVAISEFEICRVCNKSLAALELNLVSFAFPNYVTKDFQPLAFSSGLPAH
jgi:hypothetical protein